MCVPSASPPEDSSRLLTLDVIRMDPGLIIAALERDSVVLIRNIAPAQADAVLHDVTSALGLLAGLQAQAAYATFFGHRQRIGKYRMSVNKRDEYQFVPPHSEGDSFVNIQLASFYCLENTTDGGETLLLNVDEHSAGWNLLRERVTRISPGCRALSSGELKQATAFYHLHPRPEVAVDDRILQERPSDIPGLKLVEVLAKARRTRSSILGRDLHAYWFNIANSDHDALPFYVALLKESNLLRAPPEGRAITQMDNASTQRVWSSGVDYNKLFRCKLIHKLMHGDLVLQNNLTWTHAVSNWSPQSGVRKVAAAFA